MGLDPDVDILMSHQVTLLEGIDHDPLGEAIINSCLHIRVHCSLEKDNMAIVMQSGIRNDRR